MVIKQVVNMLLIYFHLLIYLLSQTFFVLFFCCWLFLQVNFVQKKTL